MISYVILSALCAHRVLQIAQTGAINIMRSRMDKVYQPQQIESHWAKLWEKRGFMKPSGDGHSYCIMLPPPNVTGRLHMGHGFQHTLIDALIRQHRMRKFNTLWQGGTDHAGIATQMVVERRLAQENISRHDLGREQFVAKVWDWKEESGSTITGQIRRLGASIDWSRERFSMDKGISYATREAFIRLFEEGLIYRGKRLVNWDPHLQSAISDLEVSTETEKGHLWYMQYPLSDGSGQLTVATTRPETMLGDTAVAVHPDDERYQSFIGKTVRLPLADRDIPVIADDAVDKEFGTGCVKITPAHDFNDYEMGKRHDLPMMNILTLDAHLNASVPNKYRGLSTYEARKIIVADLENLNLIEKIEPHDLNVPRGERSGAVIEPMLTDQWFMKMKALAEPAMAAVTKGDIQLVPGNWAKTYLQWLENIQDWCISRQLWWGHRIPVWYDDAENCYVGHDEADARQRNQLGDDVVLRRDADVLDTWFSASLWPFASLGWPQQTPEFETFYPTDVLVTGFDIIFFWVARMVMMGLKLTGNIPFHTVYITGLIRDSKGQKMSKSKGNILDPINLIDGIDLESLIEKRTTGLMQPKMSPKIEKATRKEFPDGIAAYGTDALRFTFCALASTGRDINFDMGRIEGYRNFCNKIWNAARFVFMHTEGKDLSKNNAEYSLADLWIRSALQETIKRVNEHFENYRFDLLAQALYEFIWNEYCDWYLELAKCVLNNPSASAEQLRGTRNTLVAVLETLLRLLHPVMPYITEEIWQTAAPMLGIQGESIMLQQFPAYDQAEVHAKAQADIEWLKAIIGSIRNIRSETGINPSQNISVIFSKGTEQDQQCAKQCESYIKVLARAQVVKWENDKNVLGTCATDVVNQLEVYIPLAGLINKEVEMSRLDKEISKIKKEQEKFMHKLNNPNYVKKAPPEIVAKERQRLEQSESTLKKLQEHYEQIESL